MSTRPRLPSACATRESAAAYLVRTLGGRDGEGVARLAAVVAEHLRDERRPTADELRRAVASADALARQLRHLRGSSLRPFLESLLRDTAVQVSVLADVLREPGGEPAAAAAGAHAVIDVDGRVGFAVLLRSGTGPRAGLTPRQLLAAAVCAGVVRPTGRAGERRAVARWEEIARRSEQLAAELHAFERRRRESATLALAHADALRPHSPRG